MSNTVITGRGGLVIDDAYIAADPPRYTLGDFCNIQRRERAGEPVTAEEQAALALYREHAAASPTLQQAATKLRSPEYRQALAAYEAMPAHRQATYEHRPVESLRGDPLFQSYVHRGGRRTSSSSGRPRARRTSSSSTTSGCDPSSSSESDQPAEPLRLAPSRAVLAFACLTAEARGEQATS